MGVANIPSWEEGVGDWNSMVVEEILVWEEGLLDSVQSLEVPLKFVNCILS
jgi:hypothetical protein